MTKRSASCRVIALTMSSETRSIFVSLTLSKFLLTLMLSTSGSTQSHVCWLRSGRISTACEELRYCLLRVPGNTYHVLAHAAQLFFFQAEGIARCSQVRHLKELHEQLKKKKSRVWRSPYIWSVRNGSLCVCCAALYLDWLEWKGVWMVLKKMWKKITDFDIAR